MREPSIMRDFLRDDADRRETLDRARLCAALTKPWVLPPDGWSEDEKLPETFTSLASRGISNLEGRLLLALFPASGQPFFKLKPGSKFLYDPEVDPAMLKEFNDRLQLHELIIMAHLDRADNKGKSNGRRAGFRSRMRTALSQLLITGDVLCQLHDDFSLRVYRRDNYVTRRDSTGDVLYHIIREKIDPLVLDEDQLISCDLSKDDLLDESPRDRMEDLYTKIEWQPLSNRWKIQQECRDKIIVEYEEKVTPFLSTPFELAPGANYGRGLIEQNIGDVRAINELSERLLDHAAIASKMLFALDYNSQVRPQDLAQPTGSVIQARVQQGQITDVGLMKAEKMNDFQVANIARESIRKDLSTVMLMEADQLPQYDRASRYHVQRVAMELEGALGGVYAPIADSIQIGLIERARAILTRKGLLPSMPQDSVEVEAVTGLQAMSNESDSEKMMGLLQVVSQLGPETMNRVNKAVLLDMMMRHACIYEPGLIRSEEEIQAEIEEQRQAMMQQQVAEQALKTGGKLVEQAPMQENANNVG